MSVIARCCRDLGTYWVRVEFEDGRGFYSRWDTSARYITGGTQDEAPLSATRVQPVWESDEDVTSCIYFWWVDGNGSCDCNRTLYWLRANNESPDIDDARVACGDTITLKRLTAIRPDGTEKELWP